jgi:hypothetical protein
VRCPGFDLPAQWIDSASRPVDSARMLPRHSIGSTVQNLKGDVRCERQKDVGKHCFYAEQTKINNKLSPFKYHPVISFGFGYRF